MNRGRRALAAALRVRPLTARLLVARGITEAEPAALPGAAARGPAAARRWPVCRARSTARAALAAGESIGVFGDYDVDGVTTAALLTGPARAPAGRWPRVARRDAGYGLGVATSSRFAARLPLVVTGDCGTSDLDALRAARARGIDVDRRRPPRAARGRDRGVRAGQSVPPRRHVPFRGWRRSASRSIWRRRCARGWAPAFDPRELLDLVALGTIADLVPLIAENRILVAAGLARLSPRSGPGIAALAARAELRAARSRPTTPRFA